MVRPRFDINRDLVAARNFTYDGKQLATGDPFPKDGVAPHRLRTLYGSRLVNHDDGTAKPADAPIDDGVTMTATPGGWYDISAPWLDSPQRVRGKVQAERALAELREAGEPAYHHGVRVEPGENGWYSVQADWMGEDAYNVHGEDAAREQAARLRAEGPPPDPRTSVTVAEDGDEFVVNAPWLEEAETYESREAAEGRRDQLQEAGPPDGWEPAPQGE